MTVVFHSDYSVTRNGFKATWEAVEILETVVTSGISFSYGNRMVFITYLVHYQERSSRQTILLLILITWMR